ncbi:MAG: hypothetical protein NW202_02365 [Nitrospira sp.]|nr:hypothetical protein [Nitrospira sp.]
MMTTLGQETRRRIAKLLMNLTIFCMMLLMSGLVLPGESQAQRGNRTDIEIDHTVTGFPLSGGHAQVPCERCHVQGLFRGTPTQCMQCHSPGGRVVSTFKPANHIPTTINCNSCHRTTGWMPAFFTHNGVKPGTCSSCHNQSTAVGKPVTHIPTTMACDSCHKTVSWMGAAFKHHGIAPGSCMACHNGVQARGKPASHMSTSASCDSCHRMGAANWTLVSGGYDHTGIAPGTCGSCHNGTKATGKPTSHIPTSAACDSCHKTTGWVPATMNHTGIAPGICASCHNGTTAKGKTATHVPTTQSCDVCHRTTAWIPATFSHTGIAPGTCASCHNGTTARGKTATHVPTTQSCDVCHRTTAWIPATFSHTGVAPGTCATCHNGTTATGKSTAHFVTTQSCDVCHRTTAWTPVTTYTHKNAAYKAHRSSVLCLDCHKNNNEVIAWPNAAYKPDCAGCHANDYKQGPHKKVDSPAIYYTVAELKNCSGSCHMYADATMTRITKSRTSEHQPTGSF